MLCGASGVRAIAESLQSIYWEIQAPGPLLRSDGSRKVVSPSEAVIARGPGD